MEEEKEIDKDSLAADSLRNVVDNGYFDSIYTFNYTSLGKVLKALGLNSCKYRYVHGSLEHNSAILGIETPLKDIQGECHYLLKTFNEHYESNPIQYDLQEADEVVIFGHSLSQNDYHFFSDFFWRQCRPDMTRKDSKRITIFTFNDDSRFQILKNLIRMTEDNLPRLFEMNKLVFIHTSRDKDSEDYSDFVRHLQEDSVRQHIEDNRIIAKILP